MTPHSSARRITLCAVCIALCYVLPLAFHTVGLGSMLSPMHIPVLLCGLVCGGGYGLICGIAGPLLSSLLSGMPGPMGLMTMVPELAVYGLSAGIFMKLIRTRNNCADIYITLIIAMVFGRIAGGIAQVIVIKAMVLDIVFNLFIWINSYFIGTLPGIVCHLILIPLLVLTLTKAKVIPSRYPQTV